MPMAMPRVILYCSMPISIAWAPGPRAIVRLCVDMTSGISPTTMSWYQASGEHPTNGDGVYYKRLIKSQIFIFTFSYFHSGWKEEDTKDLTQYGCRLNFYKWSTQTLYQTVDLGLDGFTPLEVRFLHDPKRPDGFVGCCLNAKVFYFKKKPDSDEFDVKKVIDIPEKLVDTGSGTASKMGGMISDIIISLDDRFLYVNCWLHGDVRQYDITNPEEPKLISQLFLGGAICNDLPNVTVHEDLELTVS